MSLQQRKDCQLQVARFIAMNDGRVWHRLPQKVVDQYMTVASNILACVERHMSMYSWRDHV